MNIKINLVDMQKEVNAITGGGYAVTTTEVFLDKDMDGRLMSELVIHEILDSYMQFLSHDKIDELTNLILDGLAQITNGKIGSDP